MGDARDLEDYMNELLDASNPQTKVFIKELLVKWREAKCRGSKKAEVLWCILCVLDQAGDIFIAEQKQLRTQYFEFDAMFFCVTTESIYG